MKYRRVGIVFIAFCLGAATGASTLYMLTAPKEGTPGLNEVWVTYPMGVTISVSRQAARLCLAR